MSASDTVCPSLCDVSDTVLLCDTTFSKLVVVLWSSVICMHDGFWNCECEYVRRNFTLCFRIVNVNVNVNLVNCEL